MKYLILLLFLIGCESKCIDNKVYEKRGGIWIKVRGSIDCHPLNDYEYSEEQR